MKYLLDADWAISFLHGRHEAVDLVGRIADKGIALSIITYGEIWEGLLTTRVSEHSREFAEFIETIDLLTIDVEVALRYAEARSHLRSEGSLIPDNDLWIAATALRHSLTLVSRDQHFARIAGLKLHALT